MHKREGHGGNIETALGNSTRKVSDHATASHGTDNRGFNVSHFKVTEL